MQACGLVMGLLDPLLRTDNQPTPSRVPMGQVVGRPVEQASESQSDPKVLKKEPVVLKEPEPKGPEPKEPKADGTGGHEVAAGENPPKIVSKEVAAGENQPEGGAGDGSQAAKETATAAADSAGSGQQGDTKSADAAAQNSSPGKADAATNHSPGKAISVSSSQTCTPPQLAARRLSIFQAGFQGAKAPKPPCRSYRNLITFGDFDDCINKLGRAESPSELKELALEIKPFKLAMNDLVAMSKSAQLAMQKALTSAKKTASGASKKDGKKSDGKSKKDAEQVSKSLFEQGAELGTGFEEVKLGDGPLPICSCSTPMLLKIGTAHAMFEPEHELKKAVRHFTNKFATSSLRTSQGRAERTLKGAALAEVDKLLPSLVTTSEVLNQREIRPPHPYPVRRPSRWNGRSGAEVNMELLWGSGDVWGGNGCGEAG